MDGTGVTDFEIGEIENTQQSGVDEFYVACAMIAE